MKIDLRRPGDRSRYKAGTYRVVADGRDLSNRVFYVDGRRRIVGVNKVNSQGLAYLEYDESGEPEIAREFLRPRRVRLVKR